MVFEFKERSEIQDRISAKVINTMVPCVIAAIVIGTTAAFLIPGQQLRLLPEIVAAFFLLFIWWLVRKGKVHLAAHTFTILLCSVMLVGMIFNGGVTAPAYMAAFATIALAAWLYGPRVSILFYIFLVILGGVFAGLATLELLPAFQPLPPWIQWLATVTLFTLMLGTTTVPNAMLRSTLEESEKRRINAEEAYDREKHALEDLTAGKQALKESEQNLKAIFNSTSEAILIYDAEIAQLLDVNDSMLKIYGYEHKEDVFASNLENLSAEIQPGSNENASKLLRKAIQESPCVFEWLAKRRDETTFWTEISLRQFQISGTEKCIAVVRDISERKYAEAERENLEKQLQQSQKLEAIGQMAGGIAHDFNNLLLIILGNIEALLDNSDFTKSNMELLEDIQGAGNRAADLTRQLLTFSRRQTAQPTNLILNTVIQEILKMIRRVIGEHIQLNFIPGKPLGTVYMDKGQIEQILLNLCMNARDAMPKGGQLSIQTSNIVIDTNVSHEYAEMAAGQYVLLSVTDTGCGMDKLTSEKIFDPFFTTKEVGKGTGLGLAMVYGIVKQNKGMIHVYSELGKGTTFKLYFPITKESVTEITSKKKQKATGGTETILVAEDDDMVRRLVVRMLEHAGYAVLEAKDGEETLNLYEKHADAIDMVLMDVVMPKLGGLEVMKEIKNINPQSRFLFCSGYYEGAGDTDFVIKEEFRMIAKPYKMTDLLVVIREILDDPLDTHV